jgi:hypothetical protein
MFSRPFYPVVPIVRLAQLARGVAREQPLSEFGSGR